MHLALKLKFREYQHDIVCPSAPTALAELYVMVAAVLKHETHVVQDRTGRSPHFIIRTSSLNMKKRLEITESTQLSVIVYFEAAFVCLTSGCPIDLLRSMPLKFVNSIRPGLLF